MDVNTVLLYAGVGFAALIAVIFVIVKLVKRSKNSEASFYKTSKKAPVKKAPAKAQIVDENIHPELTIELLKASASAIKLFESTIGSTSAESIRKVRKYFAEQLNDSEGGYPERTDKYFQMYRMTVFGEPRHVIYLEFDPDSDPEVVERVFIYLDKNYAERYRGALLKMFGRPDDKSSLRQKGQYNVFRYEFYKDSKYRLTFTESETYGGCSLMIESKHSTFNADNIKTDAPTM